MPLIDHNTLKQRNAGKVQFNAVREEALALLAKGHSRRALHAVLHEMGIFTGSYRRFCEYVKGIEKCERGPKNPEAAPAREQTRERARGAESGAGRGRREKIPQPRNEGRQEREEGHKPFRDMLTKLGKR